MKDYKEWIVWQKSMDLVTLIYTVTSVFPKVEVMKMLSKMVFRGVI